MHVVIRCLIPQAREDVQEQFAAGWDIANGGVSSGEIFGGNLIDTGVFIHIFESVSESFDIDWVGPYKEVDVFGSPGDAMEVECNSSDEDVVELPLFKTRQELHDLIKIHSVL